MTAITITLNRIREHDPCKDGWRKLLAYLGKTEADDEPFPLSVVLDSNGLDDTIWCLQLLTEHDRLWRHFACDCAEDVAHLLTDERSVEVIRVARRYADGEATAEDLSAANDAAWSAARAARASADDAAYAAIYAAYAAVSVAKEAADDAALDSARHAIATGVAGTSVLATQAARLRVYLDTGERPEGVRK